jgi:inositol hexakisphosphate/diphosphoinositol-pentakisphosphate kinase
LQEIVAMMTDLRKILIDNFEKVNVDKIQSRWCSGDSPDLFKERWEKLFEDWVGVKKEKVRRAKTAPTLGSALTD